MGWHFSTVLLDWNVLKNKVDMFSCMWNDGMPSTQEICFPSIANIETRDCLMIHKLKINFAISTRPTIWFWLRAKQYIKILMIITNKFHQVSLSVCLFIHPSVCLSACLSVCLYVCLSVCLPVSLSICLSVCLFFCLSPYLSVCLPTCLPSVPVCLSLYTVPDCYSAILIKLL